uniref:Uncharacterized protein n=1 Tax=Anguilla anguilla TaxID=7936 RepID=A0A0E9P8Y0_ANGAN
MTYTQNMKKVHICNQMHAAVHSMTDRHLKTTHADIMLYFLAVLLTGVSHCFHQMLVH